MQKLISYRAEIKEVLSKMDNILQIYFSSEYDIAYQHWMPQIMTALYDDTRWLPRGSHSMQYTIDHIKDSIVTNNKEKGVIKYIK